MRGNRTGRPDPRAARRSIPACAGEPRLRQTETARYGVYPRLCGGTLHRLELDSDALGLSPRVRGNRSNRDVVTQSTRSIPACAGEPSGRRPSEGWKWVYPRVCGGTATSRRTSSMMQGLSPRVRGNLVKGLGKVYSNGSIPACAGEPPSGQPCRAPRRVYPRVCGGTSAAFCSSAYRRGLSPSRVPGGGVKESV